MSGKSFIDTNVLVYLFDARDPTRRSRSAELLQQLVDDRETLIISTQVLQEAYVSLTRKLHMDGAERSHPCR